MARRCDVCGKGPIVGYNVSHAHNKTKKRWIPNLHSIRIKVQETGEVRRIKICSSCLKANKVQKYVSLPA